MTPTRVPRRRRALLAAATTIGLLGATSLTALPVAYAADVEETITDFQTFGDIQVDNNFLVQFKWSVPDNTKKDDTFFLKLPEELAPVQTSFPLKNAAGDTVANAVVTDAEGTDNDGVTVTFTDYVTKHPYDIEGTMRFNLRVERGTTPGVEIPISWAGTSITPIKPWSGPINVNGFSKWGTYNDDPEAGENYGVNRWVIEVPGGIDNAVITDTPKDHFIQCSSIKMHIATPNTTTGQYENRRDFTDFTKNCTDEGGFVLKLTKTAPAGEMLFVTSLVDTSKSSQLDPDLNGVLTNTYTVTGSRNSGPKESNHVLYEASGTAHAGSALGAVGDFVWYDTNEDGLQDETEDPVEGVTVTLYQNGEPVLKEDGTPVTTKTDDEGYYIFEELPFGEYSVRFSDIPEGFVFTQPNVGDNGNDRQDSDAGPANGRTAPVEISRAHPRNMSLDAGIHKPTVVPEILGSVGDYVWYDEDRDGVQDEDEKPVPGVTVTLLDAEGKQVGEPIKTDKDGKYLFDELPLGEYSVEFSDYPEGYTVTTPNSGDDDAADSDPDPKTGRTASVTITEQTPDIMTLDAGLVTEPEILGSVGDYVWYDEDRDGVQDEGEKPVPGVTVTLYDAEGNPVGDPIKTDAEGKYLFSDLPLGEYSVGFSDYPAGYVPTTPNAGDDDAADSDADANGRTVKVTLTADAPHNRTLDAGLIIEPTPTPTPTPTPSESTPVVVPSQPNQPNNPNQPNQPHRDGGRLANTGAEGALIAGGLGLLTVAVGAGLILANRRRSA